MPSPAQTSFASAPPSLLFSSKALPTCWNRSEEGRAWLARWFRPVFKPHRSSRWCRRLATTLTPRLATTPRRGLGRARTGSAGHVVGGVKHASRHSHLHAELSSNNVFSSHSRLGIPSLPCLILKLERHETRARLYETRDTWQSFTQDCQGAKTGISSIFAFVVFVPRLHLRVPRPGMCARRIELSQDCELSHKTMRCHRQLAKCRRFRSGQNLTAYSATR